MTKKSGSNRDKPSKTTRKTTQAKATTAQRTTTERRTLLGTLIGIIVLIAAFVANQLGISLTPAPTLTAAPTRVPPTVTVTPLPATVAPPTAVAGLATPFDPSGLQMTQGFTAQKGFWQVFFTAPTGSRDRATYTGGIDVHLARAIARTQRTLDIAAFEFNNAPLTAAVLDAHRRGVTVRMVTDNVHGVNDDDTTIGQFIQAGIPVVDDNRSALMHNKFMILDGTQVWTGSWNFTVNDTYRNNNNALALRSRRLVDMYQAEFNQMFEGRRFGTRKTPGMGGSFIQDGVRVQVYFSPRDLVLQNLIGTLNAAQKNIRFMNFSFTDFDTAKAIMDRAAAGVAVQGIWETTGSETQASELRTLFCAGLDVRQDGNPFVLHHKVFIVDDRTVISGSFNISSNATNSNDENLIILDDPDLAAHYIAEFERRWAEARVPGRITCQ